ncbi:hypothetical protein Bca52824_023478 [Brassica carinata]|uniref:Uncharacterized protein n=1 Tax=Brassica carinata TaxID=52824 RepID=A0A8X7VII7_BRACI|nr:hypothetical protein Bca52824_023478 [Brassica carinata]
MAALDWIWIFCKLFSGVNKDLHQDHVSLTFREEFRGCDFGKSGKRLENESSRYTENFKLSYLVMGQISDLQGIGNGIGCGYAGFTRKLHVYRRALERSSYVVEFMFKPYGTG